MMRRFVVKTLLAALLAATLGSLPAAYDVYVNCRHTDYRLPAGTRTLLLGPSTIQTALDDSLLAATVNLGSTAALYPLIYPLLEQVLETNPSIDTVVLAHGIFLTRTFPDSDMRHRSRGYLTQVAYPLIHLAHWPVYRDMLLPNPDFYRLFLTPDREQLRLPKRGRTLSQWGYNQCKGRDVVCTLFEGNWTCNVAWYDSVYRAEGSDRDQYTRAYIEERYTLNLSYVDSILALCHRRGVTPVLFFPPMYEIDRWVSDRGFRDYMRAHYDPTLLVADYTHFAFPTTDYYQDVHHLNIHGAAYLTSHIAQEGWALQPLSDWLAAPIHHSSFITHH